MRRYLIFSIIYLTAALCCAGEAVVPAVTAAAEDPVPWTPPAHRPPFRAIKIAADDFKARIIAVGKAYDAFSKNRDKLPQKGWCIETIEPDSTAKKLGLKELDVITKVDGAEFDFNTQKFSDAKHKVTIQRYGQAPRDVDVPIGRMGIMMNVYTRDEMPVIAIAPDPKWDEHVANFKRAFVFDPELAELELYRAIAAGLPENEQTDFWFSRLALAQFNYPRAIDFSWLAAEGGVKDDLVQQIFISAASASYKLNALRQILKKPAKPDELRSGTVERLMTAYDALPGRSGSFLVRSRRRPRC